MFFFVLTLFCAIPPNMGTKLPTEIWIESPEVSGVNYSRHSVRSRILSDFTVWKNHKSDHIPPIYGTLSEFFPQKSGAKNIEAAPKSVGGIKNWQNKDKTGREAPKLFQICV